MTHHIVRTGYTNSELRQMTHPKDDPAFGSTIDEPVWYMAHPLAPDKDYSYQQNMDHAVHMAGLFYECGVRVVVPWHTLCLALDDSNPEHRRIGLEVDCYLVRRLGRLILCGHKLSKGMRTEVESIMGTYPAFDEFYVRRANIEGNTIVNLIGFNDAAIRTYYHELKSARDFINPNV